MYKKLKAELLRRGVSDELRATAEAQCRQQIKNLEKSMKFSTEVFLKTFSEARR